MGCLPDRSRGAVSVMNRVMDAFGAESPSTRQLEMSAKILLDRGYEIV